MLMVSVPVIIFSQDSKDTSKSKDKYLTVPVNLSFFPGFSIGESVAQGKKIKNHVSFNILAGSAAKLEGVEFGGCVNINSEDVVGAQFAGIANLNGDEVTGAQFAGIANIVDGEVTGAQLAGIANISDGDITGALWAGIANISDGKITGAQWAGIANISDGKFTGAQWAGISNINGSEITGAQWAGIANLNDGEVTGAQWAGIANISQNFTGAQWAGIANISEEFSGIQFAGIVNIAEKVGGGIQIAPVNISEENDGIPIGLISIVGDVGFHYDVWTDENLFANFGLRSGTKTFHNLIFLGIQTKEKKRFTMGSAFGAHIKLSDKFYMEPDVSWQYIKEEKDKFWSKVSDNLFKFRLLAGWKLTDFMSVYAGPTFNYYISKYRDGNELTTSDLFEGTSGKYSYRAWLGFNAGIRF